MKCRRHKVVKGLSPFCPCDPCRDRRAGWFSTWIVVLARRAGVTVEQAITKNTDLDLLKRSLAKGP